MPSPFLTLIEAITGGDSETLSDPIAVPPSARAAYARLIEARKAHVHALAVHQIADNQLDAAKGAVMLALIEAGLITPKTQHRINDDGTFQIKTDPNEPAPAKVPDWVAEEIRKFREEAANGNGS